MYNQLAKLTSLRFPRHLGLLVAMLVALSGLAWGQVVVKYQDFAAQGTSVSVVGVSSTNKAAIVYPSCTVTVYLTGTLTLATLYSDSALTPLANPFNATAEGLVAFYAAPATYDIRFSGTGITVPFTRSVVDVGLSRASQIEYYSLAGRPTCSAALRGRQIKLTDNNRGTQTCSLTTTATYTWVYDNPVYDLSNFGTTNTAFGEWVTALNATSGAKGVIPTGTYTITTGRTITANNITIEGDGASSVLSVTLSGGAALSVTGDNFKISKVKFTGEASRMLSLVGVDFGVVEECTISGATVADATASAGVYVQGGTKIRLERNILSGNGTGVTTDDHADIYFDTTGTTGVRITKNTASSTSVTANIALFNCFDFEVDSNVVSGATTGSGQANRGYGIVAYRTSGGTTQRALIHDNQVSTTGGAGIYVQSVDGAIIHHNIVKSPMQLMSDASLIVAGIGVTAGSATISDNEVYDSLLAGIAFAGEGNIVAGNKVYTSGYAGIWARDARKTIISENYVGTSTNSGILAYLGTLNDLTLSGNIVQGSGTTSAGVRLISVTGGIVKGNHVFSTGGHGISLETCDKFKVNTNIVIQGSAGAANTYSALYLTATTNTTVENNRAYNSSGTGFKYGLEEAGATTSNTFRNNDLAGQTGASSVTSEIVTPDQTKYLAGASSNLQTQITARALLTANTFSGTQATSSGSWRSTGSGAGFLAWLDATPSLAARLIVSGTGQGLIGTYNGSAWRNALTIENGATDGAITIDSSGKLKIGSSGSAVSSIISGTASLDYAQALANTCETLTLTVTGAADGDTAQLGIPHALANHNTTATFFGWRSASNTVSVRRCVISADGSDPAAATVRATVTQH